MTCASEIMWPMDIHGLLGLGIRRRREQLGLRQEDAAQRFQVNGLPTWRRSTVAQVEAGTRRPSLGDLLLVAMALECDLVSLIPEDVKEPVDLSPNVAVPPALVRMLLADWDKFRELPGYEHPDEWLPRALERQRAVRERLRPQLQMIRERSPRQVIARDRRIAFGPATEAEVRAADRLKVEPPVLKFASRILWDRNFEEERDSRAGDGDVPPPTLQARRGHATRAMLDQLRDFLHEAGVIPGE